MVVVQRRHHEVDVVADDRGALVVTRRDTADEPDRIVEIPAEALVHNLHFEGITRHPGLHYSAPEVA